MFRFFVYSIFVDYSKVQYVFQATVLSSKRTDLELYSYSKSEDQAV